jgi:hypothetical protein
MQTQRRSPCVAANQSCAARAASLAMDRGGENPADLGRQVEIGPEAPAAVEQSDLSDDGTARLLLDHEQAVPEQRPVSGDAQKTLPGFLAIERAPSDEAQDSGVAAPRVKRVEIIASGWAQAQAFGVQHRLH